MSGDEAFRLRRLTSLPGAWAERLLAIEGQADHPRWGSEDFAAELGTATELWVVETEPGTVVGFLSFAVMADEAEIRNLGVARRWRRRGGGGLLVAQAMHRARARGAKSLFLEVRQGNQAAQRLYLDLGFKVVGERRRYYRAPLENALLLRCPL